MAVAKKIEKVVKSVTVNLQLSEPEANTIAAILNRVSGDPKTSARGYADDVLKALDAAGIRAYWTPEGNEDGSFIGSLTFGGGSRRRVEGSQPE